MPGPTTEAVNEDVKALRDDLHKVEVSVRESIHKVELDVREVSTKIGGVLGSIRILAVVVLSSVCGSIWWGASISSDVRHLTSEISELRQELSGAKIVARETNVRRIAPAVEDDVPPPGIKPSSK